jgi:hypothetical protein
MLAIPEDASAQQITHTLKESECAKDYEMKAGNIINLRSKVVDLLCMLTNRNVHSVLAAVRHLPFAQAPSKEFTGKQGPVEYLAEQRLPAPCNRSLPHVQISLWVHAVLHQSSRAQALVQYCRNVQTVGDRPCRPDHVRPT